jgi:uridine kinase
MKVLILVSGSLRSFRENIQQIPPEYDIAVYTSRDEGDTYLNPRALHKLFEEPRINMLLVEESSPTLMTNTRRQWYKLQRLWQAVPKTYDRYVRMRPDILLTNPDDLRAAVNASVFLSIPEGNDRDGINDQLAIGTAEGMDTYAQIVTEQTGHTSEYTLASHLANVPVVRVSIPYKLILSCAKVVAIAGDSGSGKSTMCNLIRPLFLFDKVLEYETDRYHKWERGDVHWNTTSHLHPDANHLEKLENDTFNLKVGNTVFAVDYDHSTGTFTPPAAIESKENILLCGLHTLYTKQLRNLSDLKIYLDTSEDLKFEWKIHRDTRVRNQTPEEVRRKIESRQVDYTTHVAPQQEHADIIITRDATRLRIQAPGHREWVPGTGYWESPEVDVRSEIYDFLASLHLPTIEARAGFDGVIQLTVLRALYTKDG